LASALQRLPIEDRWLLLGALASRGEDVDDPVIPRLLWYALEPAVVAHPDKSLSTAIDGKMPFLQESVARRMASGSLAGLDGKAPPGQDRQVKWKEIVNEIAPGFEAGNVGEGGVVALSSFRNVRAVQTHPKNREVACTLSRHVDVPEGKQTMLKIRASYHPHGDWQLRVLAGKEILADQIVSYETVQREWLELNIDLTRYAGKHLDLVLENRANDWKNEFGYWGSVQIVSDDIEVSD